MKKLLLLLLALFSMPANATDSRYLQCLNGFPEKILVLKMSNGAVNYLEKRQVSEYESKVKDAGYGIYYRDFIDTEEGRVSMCRVSLFIYTGDSRQNPPQKKFSKPALAGHLLDYAFAMSQDGNRKIKDISSNIGANVQPSVSPDALPGLFGSMQIKGQEVLLVTFFFENEVERYALMPYKNHYLKGLLTCQTFDDFEMDKNRMSLLTEKTFLTALNFLDKCTVSTVKGK